MNNNCNFTPRSNPETGMIEGDLLSEGTDYEIENGVTRFLRDQDGKVLCVMTNSIFPNLTLITDLIALDPAGVEEMAYDSDEYVKYTRFRESLCRKARSRML